MMPNRKLKRLRALKGMLQADVADKLQMSKVTYNRKENGMVDFTTREINLLLKLFKCKYEDIFELEG